MKDLTNTIQGVLNVVGSFFSIASFVITVFVLLNVRKLRAFYRLRVRGPSLIRELSKLALDLSNYLNEYHDFMPQITEGFGKVGVKLKSLQRIKLSGDTKKSVKRVLFYIDQCEVKTENEEQVRKVHIEIIKIVEELKDHQKDLNWEA